MKYIDIYILYFIDKIKYETKNISFIDELIRLFKNKYFHRSFCRKDGLLNIRLLCHI